MKDVLTIFGAILLSFGLMYGVCLIIFPVRMGFPKYKNPPPPPKSRDESLKEAIILRDTLNTLIKEYEQEKTN